MPLVMHCFKPGAASEVIGLAPSEGNLSSVLRASGGPESLETGELHELSPSGPSGTGGWNVVPCPWSLPSARQKSSCPCSDEEIRS